jgi:hypothetical protein
VRELDLFGRWASRWRVSAGVGRLAECARSTVAEGLKGIRTSNAYVCRDPQPALAGIPTSKEDCSRTGAARRIQQGATRRTIYRDRRRGEVATSARPPPRTAAPPPFLGGVGGGCHAGY